jgi:spermidine/putrescine transport system ATP-binding protein
VTTVHDRSKVPATSQSGNVVLRRVTKKFGDQVAVDDVSLEILSGEFLSLLGPSGCGKTTTLRMLGGFETPTAGSIFFGDHDVTELPPHRREVNTVFQSYALFPHLSVADNIAFGLRRKGVSKTQARAKVSTMLDLVDLGGLAERRPAALSGGQQQRVALARALVNEPTLLLLDEPMSALDAKLRKHMQIELKRIQQEVGITFLYVTHDQEEAMTMSDRIVVMQRGRIEGLGQPRALYEQPGTAFVATFLGASNLLAVDHVRLSGDVATISLGGGKTMKVLASALPKDLRSVQLCIGVRPEKISMLALGQQVEPTHNVIEGQVRVATFTGVGNQYLVETTTGEEFTVYVQNAGNEYAPRAGEQVQLTWPIDHTFVVVAENLGEGDVNP